MTDKPRRQERAATTPPSPADTSSNPSAAARVWSTMWRYKFWWIVPIGLFLLAAGGLLTMTALYKDPRAPEVEAIRGIELARQGKWKEASAVFRRAVEIDPTDPSLHWYLGQALGHTNDLKEAEAQLRIAVKLAPDYVEALMDLGGVLLRQGNPREAKAQFERVLAIAPGHPGAVKALEQIARPHP